MSFPAFPPLGIQTVCAKTSPGTERPEIRRGQQVLTTRRGSRYIQDRMAFKRKRQDRSKAPGLLCCGPVDCKVPVPMFPSAEDWL